MKIMWSNGQENLNRRWGHILINRKVSQTKFVLLGEKGYYILMFNKRT